jgi:hypothetical protein
VCFRGFGEHVLVSSGVHELFLVPFECVFVQIRRFGDSEIRRFGDSGTRGFGDSGIRGFEDSEIRRLGDLSVFLSVSSGVGRFECVF